MKDLGKLSSEALKKSDKRTLTVDVLVEALADKKFTFLNGIQRETRE